MYTFFDIKIKLYIYTSEDSNGTIGILNSISF